MSVLVSALTNSIEKSVVSVFGINLCLCLCLGLTACNTGPSFYDEASPLTPPAVSPPPLKTLDAPLSDTPLTSLDASDDTTGNLNTDTEPPTKTSSTSTPTLNSTSQTGPLSSPLPQPVSSPVAASKKQASSTITTGSTRGSIKTP